MKSPYSYLILRYIHDTVTGEQLNVGVVVYSEKAKYLGACCRPTYLRISQAFPGLHGEAFRSSMRFIQSEIERISESLWRDEVFSDNESNILKVVKKILPKDDSSFQWASAGHGVSTDLSQTLEALYARLVTKYDSAKPSHNKTDEDVWRQFKKDLEKRRLLRYLQPKVINTSDDEVKFEHAWKNGAWHCLEAASFDLSRADAIRDKAHKILGQITSIRDSREKFKVHLLVGKPSSYELTETFEKAIRNLQNHGEEIEIVREEQSTEFVEKLAKEIEAHDANLFQH